ncbi:hypothetical protein [Limnoglobus roseus]|uniref:TIGR02996 domain-containing protein n=1 Tax=Limnoglobus roseus TaxID=2598579 RepID=A0A5C1AJN3_9BACT|nr:hypothetical protein [Limnoglobus roseus]QEL19411.1 hypothetical protein PX52LOC_06482 [Limnoglobus roseus]
MTSTLAALRDAVLLHPADDVVRGVYADACLESGDPATMAQGELILLQLARADEERQRKFIGLWAKPWLPAGVSHRVRLSHQHSDWWRVGPGVEVEFGRGFATGMRLTDPTDSDWTEATVGVVAEMHANSVAALFAEHPLERVVIGIGEGEEWWIELSWPHRIPEQQQWGLVSSRRERAGMGWSSSRESFSAKLDRAVNARILTLGQRVLNVQRGNRGHREWGAGII